MVRRHPARRPGAAAVEMAVISSLVMVPLMLGVWEVGRMVYVKQVVSNAAREGARLAAQSVTVNAYGSPTQIPLTGGDRSTTPRPASYVSPNLADHVYEYLTAGGLRGLTPADVTVTFEFLSTAGIVTGGRSTDSNYVTVGSKNQPYQGAKGDKFRVTVSIPWEKVRWTNAGLVFRGQSVNVQHSATWVMLVDDPFSVNTDLPNW